MTKLTEEYLESLIVKDEYHQVPNTTVTICTLILSNGFAVNGESACIELDNFSAVMGKRLAYEDALNKLWQLEGYRMKCELAKQTAAS